MDAIVCTKLQMHEIMPLANLITASGYKATGRPPSGSNEQFVLFPKTKQAKILQQGAEILNDDGTPAKVEYIEAARLMWILTEECRNEINESGHVGGQSSDHKTMIRIMGQEGYADLCMHCVMRMVVLQLPIPNSLKDDRIVRLMLSTILAVIQP